MELKVIVPCFLLFVLACGQRPTHTSFSWRQSSPILDWPKMSSLKPFERGLQSDEFKDMSLEFKDHPGSFSGESFSAEFDNIPFMNHGPVDHGLASLEDFDHPKQPARTGFNVTLLRIGGFAGSGDSRGFGAYDYPKDHYPEFQEHPHRDTISQDEFSELMKIGRGQQDGFPDPDMLIHPLPLTSQHRG